MSQDLSLEVTRRNARFRAWRALGYPVKGGWIAALAYRDDLDMLRDEWILDLRCEACGRSSMDVGLPRTLEGFEQDEREVLRDICFSKSKTREPCRHLRPLLYKRKPVNFQALYELELVAGG